METPDTPLLGAEAQTSEYHDSEPPRETPSVLNIQSDVEDSGPQPLEFATPHVVIDYGEKDRDPVKGTLCLVLYIGIWLTSFAAAPTMVCCCLTGDYVVAGVLFVTIGLCYVVPVRPSRRFRSLLRNSMGRYFQEASIRFEHLPDPQHQRPTIFCVNPHGIVSIASAHLYLTEQLSHVYFCFSTLLRLSPYFRVLSELLGHPSNVRKSTILNHLALRHSLALIPGGWHEATLHNQRRDRVHIRNRRGFIKYALQHNYTVTPCFAFGEKDTYCNVQGGYAWRFWLNSHGILAVIPWGRLLFPFLPKSVKHHTVVGTPIALPHIPNPSSKHIMYWHQVYIQHLTNLYNRYKTQFYGESARNLQLEIW